MLGQPIPEELFVTNITTGAVPRGVLEPVGLLHPTLDGRRTSYFEWLAAGSVETEAPSGTMTASDRSGGLVDGLLYGFDLERLYVRIDLSKPAAASLRDGIRCTIHFTPPIDRRLILVGEGERPVALLVQRTSDGAIEDFLETSAQVAAHEIVEASVPFSDLGLKPGDPFAFFVSIQSGLAELERHPAFRPVEGRVPDSDFERLHWRA